MKARELRIGNWVKGNRPFKVLPKDILVSYNHEKQQGESRYLPIPLTEEILLKCGFELGSNGWYSLESWLFDFNCLDISINQEFAAIEYGSRYDTHACNLTGNIRYLHQIQNLYFALTNEELEINL